jgi:hypothetical protein
METDACVLSLRVRPAREPNVRASACARLAGRHKCRHAGEADVIADGPSSRKATAIAG